MGVWGKSIGVCAMLLVCAAVPAGSQGFDIEPVTGGMVATPSADAASPRQELPDQETPQQMPPDRPPAAAPVVTTVPAPSAPRTSPTPGQVQPQAVEQALAQPAPTGEPADGTRWGVVARGGYFGLPDLIADKLFRQHPAISGYTYGAEIRYYGASGGRSGDGIGIAIDAGRTEGSGIWQIDEHDSPAAASGEINMISLTLTKYWGILPSWALHPYVGIGIGAGYFEGTVQEDDQLTEVSMLLPVFHIPIGFAGEIGQNVQLGVEARFLDGIAVGGSLQFRF